MTEEQRQRIHGIEYSCDSREELAERIVALEDAYAQKVKSSDDYMMQLMSCEISLDGMHLIYGIMSDRYDEVIDLLRDARDEYVELRDELEQWHRLTANIELPEYPITEFQPKDLERENTRLREENAKLRKLADAVKEFVEDTHCEDCPFRRDCGDNNRIFCADDFSYHAFAAMRELGIEVTNGAVRA